MLYQDRDDTDIVDWSHVESDYSYSSYSGPSNGNHLITSLNLRIVLAVIAPICLAVLFGTRRSFQVDTVERKLPRIYHDNELDFPDDYSYN